MRVSYSPDYGITLPEGHPFPIGKFVALHHILLMEGLIREEDVIEPEEAAWGDLLRAHTPEYLEALRTGTMTRQAVRRMGLPWSAVLVRRSRRAAQGTLNAAYFALADGLAANLAGGTHHAFEDHAEGFCVLNDVVYAARSLLNEGRARRLLILDLDVHQGNGTAAAFTGDERVFTFSMHGERNYPFHKVPSDYDIGLPDGMGDQAYLDVLAAALPTVFEAARPELIFYLGGVDVHTEDRFGRLKLSRQGLHQRERMVLSAIKGWGVPSVLLLSGGYAKTHEATADLHAIMHREARRVFGRVPAAAAP